MIARERKVLIGADDEDGERRFQSPISLFSYFSILLSISSTNYERIFHMKVLCAAFL